MRAGQPVSAAGREDGNPAGLADRPRELGAEPGAGAGDDHDTIVELVHGLSLT